MLKRMERRFEADPEFHRLYRDFINGYLELKHVEVIDPKTLNARKVFFLPHHGVLKRDGEKVKIRVVFNGSVKFEGLNLNDCLYVGAKLQAEQRDVIQLWRKYIYAWCTDIVKMFRQSWTAAEDQYCLLIVWRESPSEPIRIIRLCTVTYGLSCASYQAIRTLLQLAKDEGHRFPKAMEIILTRMYVDDAYGGADSAEEAKQLRKDFEELLMAGWFPLGKWAANCPDLLDVLPKEDIAHGPTLNESHNVLGLRWYPATDSFTYDVNWEIDRLTPPTKRIVLAQSAKLYGPMGWIAPVTIVFKIFLQSLWQLRVQWDDILPQASQKEWFSFTSHLKELSRVSIPRPLGGPLSQSYVEIHGFADASEKAIAAVVYLRVLGSNGRFTCTILISKTKVAPLKQISIPRLELNAACMLIKLVKHQAQLLALQDAPKFLHSDSTIVLSWIQGQPTRWSTYVANRVSQIQTEVPDAAWLHVAGVENPADLASRGATVPELLIADCWFAGPKFLCETSASWKSDAIFTPLASCPEERKQALMVHAKPAEGVEWDLLEKYSSWDKLIRVTARCQIYIDRLRERLRSGSATTKDVFNTSQVSPLNKEDVVKALIFWLKYDQQHHFSAEISALRQGRSLSARSRIAKLHPFLDEDDLLRLGGRLSHSLLEPDQKHPIILPKGTLARLLILDAHLRTLHGGVQLVLSTLRRRYWIINGRTLVKSIIKQCVVCWRQSSGTSNQLMGDLPALRVQPSRPFLHSGVDFAGPLSLRLSKGRGSKSVKGYIVIFVCMATRAVHIEVASDYSSREFIQVYKRFTARRGICATLSSDCGTNFIGADRELRELFHEASAASKKIAQALLKDGTQWRFNPPGAPHFGGLWETGVKSIKYHLRRVTGEHLLTFEELSILLAQIEASLNSRPLQALSDDPQDLSCLTPGHFLVGEALNTVPEPSVLEIPSNRLAHWQLLRRMHEDFWRRWSNEYLQSLHVRQKWHTTQPDAKVGMICRVKGENLPPGKWPLGRIVAVHPSPDDHVRVVTVKTATSVMDRPITKISLLPLACVSSSDTDEGGRDVEKEA